MAIKQAIIVRKDLGMKCGKIAAQCCHAADRCDKRVILRVDSEEELLRLYRQGHEAKGTWAKLITDAGKTQVAPGTCTVLSICGDEAVVDFLTRDLRLL